MKRNTLVQLAALVFLATITFAASAKEPPAKIYVQTKCALCHASDGSGSTQAGMQSGAKDFKLLAQSLRNDEIASIIKEGRGRMPAFKSRLNDEQVRLLVGYVRELASK